MIASPLSLPSSTASRSLWAAQALLGFMGALLLLFALALQARTTQWLSAVEQQILFEIPAPAPGYDGPISDPELLRTTLQKTPGLNHVQLLSREDIAASLHGIIENTDVLPLPILLRATATDNISASAIQKMLRDQFPRVQVHAGRQAMHDGLQQIITLRWLSYALVFVVIAVGASMSLASAFWRLDVQDGIVDLLHSMGASRAFVTRELARSNFVSVMTSAGAGLGAALLVAGIGWAFGSGANPNEIQLLTPTGIAASVSIPVALAILSALMTAWAVRSRYTPFREVKE